MYLVTLAYKLYVCSDGQKPHKRCLTIDLRQGVEKAKQKDRSVFHPATSQELCSGVLVTESAARKTFVAAD